MRTEVKTNYVWVLDKIPWTPSVIYRPKTIVRPGESKGFYYGGLFALVIAQVDYSEVLTNLGLKKTNGVVEIIQPESYERGMQPSQRYKLIGSARLVLTDSHNDSTSLVIKTKK